MTKWFEVHKLNGKSNELQAAVTHQRFLSGLFRLFKNSTFVIKALDFHFRFLKNNPIRRGEF